ncbi:MAG: STAS domain-containing protein [Clostridia bacterium]|nr:STAS domain-containing protein [Clostridia bacterium]
MKDGVKFETDGVFLRAILTGDIDHHSARGIRVAVDERLFVDKPTGLILDFSGVRFMDSSGIGLILGRLEVAREIGAGVRLEGLSPSLSKLVRLSGVERMNGITVSGER